MAELTADNCTNQMTKSTTISDLNDHCLLKIFDNFALNELIPVADTCTHFKMLAHRIARVKHIDANKVFNIVIRESPRKLLPYKKMLRLFGDLINNARVCILTNDTKSIEYIFTALCTFCNDRLDHFEIHNLQIDENDLVKRFLERIINLALADCDNVEKYLANCHDCIGLSLKGCGMDLSSILMPQLQTLDMELLDMEDDYEKIYRFLKQLKCLKTLSICCPKDFNLNYVAQLEQLQVLKIIITNSVKNFTSINKLQNLRYFKLQFDVVDVRFTNSGIMLVRNLIANLQSTDTLEHLILNALGLVLNKEYLIGLSRFKNLRSFKTGMFVETNDCDVFNHFSALSKLTILRLSTCALNEKQLSTLFCNMPSKLQQIHVVVLRFQNEKSAWMKLFKMCQQRKLSITLVAHTPSTAADKNIPQVMKDNPSILQRTDGNTKKGKRVDLFDNKNYGNESGNESDDSDEYDDEDESDAGSEVDDEDDNAHLSDDDDFQINQDTSDVEY